MLLLIVGFYFSSDCSDLYVKCQVFSSGKPISLPVQTSYKPFGTRWKCVIINCEIFNCQYFHSWNEWVTLPIHYKDLPRDAIVSNITSFIITSYISLQLTFTIYDIYGPRKAVPVGGTVVSVFGKHK